MSKQRQKVVVTGGCGFVGRHLVNALANRGDDVTVLDLGAKPFRNDVTFIDGDIRDRSCVEQALRGAALVFHNASVVHTKQNLAKTVWDINLGGSQNVLAACIANGVQKLVYVSSASVVYDGRDIENGDETLPYPKRAQAPYAASKMAAEQLLLAENGKNNLYICSLRPHIIFGPGDTRFLPAILERATKSKLRFGVGKGDKLSDFTYVSNLIDALLAAADRLGPNSVVAGQAYFITNGEPHNFFGFANRILQKLGLPQFERYLPMWLAYGAATIVELLDTLRGGTLGVESGLTRFAIRYMCTHHYFSIAKAARDLDYQPRISLEQGIELTCQALRG